MVTPLSKSTRAGFNEVINRRHWEQCLSARKFALSVKYYYFTGFFDDDDDWLYWKV